MYLFEPLMQSYGSCYSIFSQKAIVFSVLLRYTDYDYPFSIFKLCICIKALSHVTMHNVFSHLPSDTQQLIIVTCLLCDQCQGDENDMRDTISLQPVSNHHIFSSIEYISCDYLCQYYHTKLSSCGNVSRSQVLRVYTCTY